MPGIVIAQAIVGTALAAVSMVFWWLVARRWHERFRLWCERRYDVTITIGFRGHWRVDNNPDGRRSKVSQFAIEWLQLAFYIGAFFVWAIGLGLGMGLLALMQRLFG